MTECALKNLSISVFIKVLPTSVPRILATHHTTMINGDGGCRCKEDITISDFSLAMPKKKIWMIDRETFSTPLLMFSLMY